MLHETEEIYTLMNEFHPYMNNNQSGENLYAQQSQFLVALGEQGPQHLRNQPSPTLGKVKAKVLKFP